MIQTQHHSTETTLDQKLDHALSFAGTPPAMPDRLQDAALAGFDAHLGRQKISWAMVATSLGALAASLVLGFGGLTAWQSYQTEQASIAADADAFAQDLIEEDFGSEL
jgi:hypothetical protein